MHAFLELYINSRYIQVKFLQNKHSYTNIYTDIQSDRFIFQNL